MYVGNLDFVNGIDSFVKAAKAYVADHVQSDGYVHCPCVNCRNQRQFKSVEQIRYHLLVRGFMKNYRIWNKHGEDGENEPEEPSTETVRVRVDRSTHTRMPDDEDVVHDDELRPENVHPMMQDTLVDDVVRDGLDQMIRDAEPEFLDAKNLEKIKKMRQDARTPLYRGSRVSKLEADLMLLEMKSSNGLSDKGFEDLLSILISCFQPPMGSLRTHMRQSK